MLPTAAPRRRGCGGGGRGLPKPDAAAVVSVLLAALWLATASRAIADDGAARAVASETASLGWSRLPGTEACATAIELGERVEAWLGSGVLVAAPDAALSLEGRIERTPSGYRATIAVTRRGGESEGERVYEHEGLECAAATEPIALILALLIDPDAAPSAGTDAAPSAGTAAAPNAGTAAAPSAGTAAVPNAGAPGPGTDPDSTVSPLGVVVDLSAVFAAFVTPSASPSARSAVHLRFLAGPVPLGVAIVGWLSPWSRASAGAASADFLFALGGAGLCAAPQLGAGLELSICALGEAGGAFVLGQSRLLPTERERVVAFFEASVTLRARVLDVVTAHAGASLLVPFRTEPWLASDAEPRLVSAYWRPDPAGLFVFVGFGFDVGIR
jgi:hypothetical protein